MEKETNYLVVEVHNAYAVVLDNRGRFIKAANCGYEVGDVVGSIFPMIYHQDKKNRRNHMIRLAVSLAACLCLCAFGVYEYQYMYVEYGSVHMQINPDVEITLSRSGHVLNVEGENTDGKDLVKDYEYSGKEKETVVDELADLAIARQYLGDDGRIAVEVDARSDEWAETVEAELVEELNSYLQGQGLTIEVTVGPAENMDAVEEKEILEESQSITIPIPKTPSETNTPAAETDPPASKTDAPAAANDDDSDDGVTDYSVPSGSNSAPSSSAPAQSDSGYDGSGNSSYDSSGSSSYSDSSYSSSDDDDDD